MTDIHSMSPLGKRDDGDMEVDDQHMEDESDDNEEGIDVNEEENSDDDVDD